MGIVRKSMRQTAPALLVALLALTAMVSAIAQAPYPNRPIRLVVPYTPGTGIDILARAIGQKLSEKLKVAAVVDNRAGASGKAAFSVARFRADAAPTGSSSHRTRRRCRGLQHAQRSAPQSIRSFDIMLGERP